jgi:UDP-galactopyranose mutase
MSNWDVGLLPFAQNESTKFISPTKTPEYLAAGLPVVSTPITDVVRPYGEKGFVRIAGGRAEFVEAIQSALNEPRSAYRLKELDRFLAQSSWDDTWNQMETLIREVIASSRDVPVMSVGTSLNETKIGMTNPALIDKE